MNLFLRPLRAGLVLLAVAFGATVFAGGASRVYVQFAPGAKGPVRAALVQAGGQIHHEFDALGAIAVTLPDAALAGLARNPHVLLVEPDPLRELYRPVRSVEAEGAVFTGEIGPANGLYGVALVRAPEAWALGTTGAGIKVGVIDSGVFAGHEDFAGGDAALNFAGDPIAGANPWHRDFDSHGTHVVGTIAARRGNAKGVVGVAPGVGEVFMTKTFGDTGQWVYSSSLVAAVQKAVDAGSRIINMSLGGSGSSRTEQTAFDNFYKAGVLLVAAAGNAGNNQQSYPASYASVISVAAIDANKQVASFSQQNKAVELAAPGVGVLSTVSYQDVTYVDLGSGTLVSGQHVEFSGRGSVTAGLVYGGLGRMSDVSTTWSGKIVVVDRGEISFYDKVTNVASAGGVACIIVNNVAGPLYATLGDGNSSTIPALGVDLADRTALMNKVGSTVTAASLYTPPMVSGYDWFDGTSMATPHVAGVAALVWSHYRTDSRVTNAVIRQALQLSAEDLPPLGKDNATGYGLVRADAAMAKVAEILAGGGGGGGKGGGKPR